MAITPGQNPGDLQEDEIFGYGVDAGIGSFMDWEAARWLERKFRANDKYFEQLMTLIDKTYIHTRSWANVTLDESSSLNCAIFSSGFGNGLYASYWGYDETDGIACLMTDFGLLVEWK